MKSLTDVAVVGLERAGDLADDEASAGLVAGLEIASAPEQRFLLRLGIAAVRARAGRKAGSARRPEPAPAETRPACSDALAHIVADLCREKSLPLLAEAIGRIDEGGMRLPASCLPDLAAVKPTSLQPAAGRVAGERGRWLAAHNTDWRWLAEGEAALSSGDRRRTWEEGALPSRLAALKAMRAESPGEGRAWVESVWKEEKAAVREELLGPLQMGLSLDDEPFLVRALGDRAVPVRAGAGRLLAHVAGSGWAVRMCERAEAILDYKAPSGGARGVLGALKARLGGEGPVGTLIVNPPATFGANWAQDGLVEKPPAGTGEKAFWVSQILALVPPTHWERRLGAEPEALVTAAVKSDWSAPLLGGWLEAATGFHATSWAAALLRGHALSESPPEKKSALALRLFPLLRQEEAESFVGPLLGSGNAGAFLPLLLALPTPWNAGFGGTFVDALERALRPGPKGLPDAYAWKGCIEKAAHGLPATLFARALALEGPATPADSAAGLLRNTIDSFRTVLNIRKRIHEETRP